MPTLRAWERGDASSQPQWRAMAISTVIALLVATLIAVAAHAIALPQNPGTLTERLLTIPFGAIVTETFAHLLLLSAIFLLTRNKTAAILVSSLIFVLVFHGQSLSASLFTYFAMAANATLSTLTGWLYTKYGFESAVLAHAIAHGIALGVN